MATSTLGPLLVIVGETASGKSQLANDLAKRLNGELVCADSWTVYKGFDIGTAKPSPDERLLVPHHLLDIVDATQGFNAALFKGLAQTAIKEIHSRANLPILVGGTGLYIDSVLYDYGFLPTAHPDERAQRNNRKLPELINEAESRDIDLSHIDIHNKRRVIRALETGGQHPTNTTLRANTLVIGIKPNRDDLRQRIAARVEGMLSSGLEQEVKGLEKNYGWTAEPMKGIGYREWQDYLHGNRTLEEVKELIISSSMNLAKRQRTWLRRNNSIHWFIDPRDAVDLATTFLNKKQ